MSANGRILLALALLGGAAGPVRAQYAVVTDNPALCVSSAGSTSTVVACTTGMNIYSRQYMSRNAFVFRAGDNCLDGYRGKGQPLVLVRCDNSKDQDWWINPNGRIQNQRNNLCIDVEGGQVAAGRRVIMWDCHSGANQNFAIGKIMTRQQAIAAGYRVDAVTRSTASLTASRFNAAGLVAAGAGNLVAAGAGNLVAAGAGN